VKRIRTLNHRGMTNGTNRIGMDSVLIDVILNYVSLGIDTMYL